MLTPQEAGDAALGQLTLGLVFIVDHLIPAMHTFLSWETEDVDLGPIVPEWCGSGSCINYNCTCSSTSAIKPLPPQQAA